MNLKGVFSTILIILKGWSEFRKFWKSFSDFISDFIVVSESSYKDFWEINGKFVGNIPGWDDAWSQVWCVGLKIWVGQEFLL